MMRITRVYAVMLGGLLWALPAVQAFGQEATPPLDTAHLLANENFASWDDKGPVGWDCSKGASAKQSKEQYDGHVVCEFVPAPSAGDSLIGQEFRSLVAFLRLNDYVHMDMLIKCEKDEKILLDLGFCYEVEGKTTWSNIRKTCPADGEWHRMEIDWAPSAENLADSPKLKSIGFGIRTIANATKPVYIADAHAWLVSTGL